MKTTILQAVAAFVLTIGAATALAQTRQLPLTGAWRAAGKGDETTMICSEKFFAVAVYDVPNRKFISTHGGSYRVEDGEWVAMIEFHSKNPALIGTEVRQKVRLQNETLILGNSSETVEWQRVDDGAPGKLAGAWLITGRARDGRMSPMTPGARRTMKILSGTRFQWIAYNVETKQFSGTGGGNYTTRDGQYTENIEFFSRDGSRVGASLTFDFAIEDGKWRHRGLSSRGEPIDEVWTRRETTGL